MIVGVPKEIKGHEYRVALLPVGAELLTQDGHQVIIERGAGVGSGFEDEEYVRAGAKIVDDADAIFNGSDLIVKVKEPQPKEISKFKPGQQVFTYFHFAASRELTAGCLDAKITAVAYETLEDKLGRLPLLTPMSEVAGKMSIQEGAKYLEKPSKGRGILLGGVAGVEPANVLILGGGVVGKAAARMAAGLGARVTIMDINLDVLRYLDEVMPANVTTVYSDPYAIRRHLAFSDLVIGAVLIPGAKAPHLIKREHLKIMPQGSVIVDVSIDQGGCAESARPTTHEHPIYIEDGVVHYCVANIPGAVSRTSAQALCNSTLPYVREIARMGADKFTKIDVGRGLALNMTGGKIVNRAVHEAFPELPSIF